MDIKGINKREVGIDRIVISDDRTQASVIYYSGHRVDFYSNEAKVLELVQEIVYENLDNVA